MENVTLPACLQTLSFGSITLSSRLQSLTCGHDFTQSMENVTLPAGLPLAFGELFNRSLEDATPPARLQSLTFDSYFNQYMENITLPSGLQSLTFGQRATTSCDNARVPSTHLEPKS